MLTAVNVADPLMDWSLVNAGVPHGSADPLADVPEYSVSPFVQSNCRFAPVASTPVHVSVNDSPEVMVFFED